MAFLIKSTINYTQLTTQVKRLVVPQLKATFSASTCSSNSIKTTMIKYKVVPDVIPVAPEEELEVNLEVLLSSD